ANATFTLARRADESRAGAVAIGPLGVLTEAVADLAAEAHGFIFETRRGLHAHTEVPADRFRIHDATLRDRAAQRQVAGVRPHPHALRRDDVQHEIAADSGHAQLARTAIEEDVAAHGLRAQVHRFRIAL